MGWFEHGSTIIVLAPDRFEFCDSVREGARIKAGQPLLRKPDDTVAGRSLVVDSAEFLPRSIIYG